MRVHDVGSPGLAHERSDLVALLWSEAEDVTAAEEAPKLHLPGRAAHLGDDG